MVRESKYLPPTQPANGGLIEASILIALRGRSLAIGLIRLVAGYDAVDGFTSRALDFDMGNPALLRQQSLAMSATHFAQHRNTLYSLLTARAAAGRPAKATLVVQGERLRLGCP